MKGDVLEYTVVQVFWLTSRQHLVFGLLMFPDLLPQLSIELGLHPSFAQHADYLHSAVSGRLQDCGL